MNEDKYLNIYRQQRKKIDAKLASVIKRRKPESLYLPGDYILTLPGKRLRPILILFSAKAVGGKFAQAYNAAVAIEMLHTFSLVHDDIMDNADKRRGHLTLHKKYDLSTAILSGDSLLSIAYEFLLKDLGKNAKEVIATFTHSLIEVCEGQSLDKEFENRNDVSIAEYLVMIKKKTAVMVETCCSIGARIGGGTQTEIKALSNFGKNIGIAFQIQDDLLDIFADEKEFGKKIGGDLIEGKKTFLFLKAIEKSEVEEKQYFLRAMEAKGILPEQIDFYKSLYKKLGVIDDARREIKRYTGKALKELKHVRKSSDREIFVWLANLLIKRTT